VSAWYPVPRKVSKEIQARRTNKTKKNGGMNMLNKFKKQMKNEKGLTLIELLAVVVILAIIAAIAIPAIGSIIDKQKDKAVLADASLIISGAKLAITDGACTEASGTTTCGKDALQPYIEGIVLAAGDQVVKTTATPATPDKPVYTLTWVSGHTFKKITGATTSGATEAQIQEWMGGKKVTP